LRPSEGTLVSDQLVLISGSLALVLVPGLIVFIIARSWGGLDQSLGKRKSKPYLSKQDAQEHLKQWPMSRRELLERLQIVSLANRKEIISYLARTMKAKHLTFWMESLPLLDYFTEDYLKEYLNRSFDESMRSYLESKADHPRVASWLKAHPRPKDRSQLDQQGGLSPLEDAVGELSEE
jgi:hypothetical protein